MSTTRPVALPSSRFPESDGVPLDTPWHRDQITFLVDLTRFLFRDRNDYYTGGNMFIYYDPRNPRKNAGPDYFYVRGVDRHRTRRIWAVWEENGRFPDVIVELLSPRTKHKDRTTKKDVYESVFRTPEYFLYDPETQRFDGWRLVDGIYQPIAPDDRGWMWSDELDLWIGKWQGVVYNEPDTWLRFYDRQGRMILSEAETERQRAELERQQAEQERQRAEQEHQQAEQERQRAEQERQQAEQERRRAEAAEAELARLRALLAQQQPPDAPTP